MPDIIRRVSNIYNKRLHDFEDDTHAEVIAARIISGGQTDALTNAQLRALAVAVSVSSGVQLDALTDAELRALPVNVDIGRRTASHARTIANGGAVSPEIDFSYYAGGVLHMPAAWTAAAIGFRVANQSGGTFQPLYDRDGLIVRIVVAVDRSYPLPEELYGCRWVQLWSVNASTGANVNQGADRVIGLDFKT